MPRPTPPHDPQHSPSAPASPGLAAPDTTAPDALAGAPTLTGAQGGPEASAWAERGRGLRGTAPPTGGHHGPISTRCGPLRPHPRGSALSNQKEWLVRLANQKLAKRARRGKRTWPKARGRWRGPGLMASGRHQ